MGSLPTLTKNGVESTWGSSSSHLTPSVRAVAQHRDFLEGDISPPTVEARAPVHATLAKSVRFSGEQIIPDRQEIQGISHQLMANDRQGELESKIEEKSSFNQIGNDGQESKPKRREEDAMNDFLFKKENFKVAAAIGLSPSTLESFPVVVDTGAGPNCVRFSVLPKAAQKKIRYRDGYKVVDANGNPLSIAGVISLFVRIGKCQVKAEFLVCNALQVPFLIGTDFIRHHVPAILPMDDKIMMKDDSEVPILSRVGEHDLSKVDLDPVRLDPAKRRSSAVRAFKGARLPPRSQTWVEVVTDFPGGVTIEPRTSLGSLGIVVANGVADVQPGVPFTILVANTRKKTIVVNRNTILARASEHPTWVMPTTMSLELLLTGTDTSCNAKSRGGSSYGKHSEGPLGEILMENQAEKVETENSQDDPVGDVDLSKFPEHLHSNARAILAKHSSMWNGKLGTCLLYTSPSPRDA